MKKLMVIFCIIFSFFAFACSNITSNNHNDYDSNYDRNNVEKELGSEIRYIRAYYLDENGKILSSSSQNITYPQSWDNIDRIIVNAVGKLNKTFTLPLKSSNANGYTISYFYNNQELSSKPEKFEAGNYRFVFKYEEFEDSLALYVDKGTLNDCELFVPQISYLEKFGDLKILNLPQDDTITISFEYRRFYESEEYIPWNYSSDDINDIFIPFTSLAFRGVITSNNYRTVVLEKVVIVETHSLKNDLTLSSDKVTLEYIPKQSIASNERCLKDYEPLLNKNLTASFMSTIIEGTFYFDKPNQEIKGLGTNNVKIIFHVANNNYFTVEDIEFVISLEIIKFHVVKPLIQDSTYLYFTEIKSSPRYSFEKVVSEDIYKLYYQECTIIELTYNEEKYPGTYPCTIALIDKERCCWENGECDDYEITWTIKRGNTIINQLAFSLNGSNNKTLLNKGDVIYKGNLISEFKFYQAVFDVETNKYEYYDISKLHHYLSIAEEDKNKADVDGFIITANEEYLKNNNGCMDFEVNLIFDDPYCDVTPSRITFILSYDNY